MFFHKMMFCIIIFHVKYQGDPTHVKSVNKELPYLRCVEMTFLRAQSAIVPNARSMFITLALGVLKVLKGTPALVV